MTGQPPVSPGGDPAPPLSESSPEETGEGQGHQPTTPELEPGRGAPLVPGPPNSVSPPISSGRINGVFGIGGLLGILVVIVIVVLVGLVLINALSHH
jgi:hypothetical protein